ncbi:MAG: hypothetical protein HN337_03140 [Deltaproteobacteria bacterium]|jgi:hypothetical protein|nr:hypothetical protein [Deltaproteobacteria bacterium]
MGDRIFPDFQLKDPTEALTFWEGVGVSGEFKVGIPIKTPISEGKGLVLGGALKLEMPDTFNGTNNIYLQYLSGTSEGNSAGTDNKQWSFQLAAGTKKGFFSYFDKDGNFRIRLSQESRPLWGIGETTIGNPNNAYSSSSHTLSIGTETGATADFMITSRLRASIGVGGYYGVDFAGSGSPYNRLKLAIMLNAEIAWSSASLSSDGNADVSVSPLTDVFEFLKLIHGGVFRYSLNATLSDQQEILGNYGIEAGEGGPGPFRNLRYFKFASSLLGGIGDSTGTYLRSKAYWGYFAGLMARGVTFSILDGDAGRTGAIGDFLGAARLGSYAIAGMESVSKRRALSDDDKILREGWANFGSYLLNTVATGIGQGTGYEPLASAGASANMSIAFQPGLVSDLTKRMDITAGATVVNPRFALNLHRDWKKLPLFTSMTVFLGGSDKEIEIHSSMGAQYKWTYLRVLAGLDNDLFFGDDAGAHVGAMAGLDLIIPFDGKDSGAGISAGVRCFVNFQGDYDCAVLGGATF